MEKSIYIFLLLLLYSGGILAQSVSINNTNADPN